MNGLIDIRTATLFNAIVGLIFWLYLTYVLRVRKTYPGFREWTVASLAVFSSMVLIGLRDAIPDWASVVGGNSLAVGALVLIARGLGRFIGRAPSRWWLTLPVLAAAGVSVLFTYQFPDVRARIVLITMISIAATVHCLATTRAPKSAQPAPATGWLVCGLAGLAFLSLVRIVLTWLYEGEIHDFLSASVIQGLFLVAYSACNIAIFLGLLVLHHQRIEGDLKQAVDEVRTLRGVIPICSSCKRIRDDQGAWNQLEAYISRHSAAEFTHGYCPDCYKQVMASLSPFP